MADATLRIYEQHLPRLQAEWQIERGDITGYDEPQLLVLAQTAYPDGSEAVDFVSDVYTARLAAKAKNG